MMDNVLKRKKMSRLTRTGVHQSAPHLALSFAAAAAADFAVLAGTASWNARSLAWNDRGSAGLCCPGLSGWLGASVGRWAAGTAGAALGLCCGSLQITTTINDDVHLYTSFSRYRAGQAPSPPMGGLHFTFYIQHKCQSSDRDEDTCCCCQQPRMRAGLGQPAGQPALPASARSRLRRSS